MEKEETKNPDTDRLRLQKRVPVWVAFLSQQVTEKYDLHCHGNPTGRTQGATPSGVLKRLI